MSEVDKDSIENSKPQASQPKKIWVEPECVAIEISTETLIGTFVNIDGGTSVSPFS